MLHTKKVMALLLSIATLMVMGLVTAGPAQAAPDRGSMDPLPVTGTVTSTTGAAAGTFDGTFTPTGFTADDGVLSVTGELVGTITDAAGAVTDVAQTVTAPVTLDSGAASCEILDLDLGPINLDLLGLVVDLSAVQLDITAVPGPGNLLGNLLCAVAGLLDGPTGVDALVDTIARLLNRVLGALG